MRFKQTIAYVLTFVWLCQDCAVARQKTPPLPPNPGPLTWSELGKFLVDKKIETRLSDKTKLRGQVLAVRADALVLDITKSSNRKMYPLEQTSIPRSSVAEIKLVRVRGPWRAVCGILGGVGGAAVTSAMTYYWLWAGLGIGAGVVIPASVVAGYYAGRKADQRRRKIIIAPDAEGEQVAALAVGETVDNVEENILP